MSHILFITQVSPLPANGGERIRSLNLLKLLSSLGHKITAIVSNEENLILDPSPIENVTFFPFLFNRTGKLIFKYFPLDERLLNIVREIENHNPIDIVFLDWGFLGQYISFFKKMKKPVIYGSHNAQSQLTSQWPTMSVREKLRKRIHYRLQVLHERNFFPNADIFLTVSENDARFYSFVGRHKMKIIPNFLDVTEYSPVSQKESYLGFSANFFSFQNYEGMKWFLDEVWGKDLADLGEILLIGKGSKELLSDFANHKNMSGRIKATGNVADTKPYIAKARAIIVPLQYGSGTRIKCLEAMALNSKIISTNKGIEGIEHNGSVLIANNALEFRNHIHSVFNNSVDTKVNSRKVIIENYSLASLQVRMDDLLSTILTSQQKNT